MSYVFFKSDDTFLQVRLGWSLSGRDGNVALKVASIELAARKADYIFDLNRDIEIEFAAYSNIVGGREFFPVLVQGQTRAEIRSTHCDAVALLSRARSLMGSPNPD